MTTSTPVELRRTSDGGIFVPSTLWLDQADAHERIEEKNRRGEITDEVAGSLAFFADNGYLIFRLDAAEELIDRVPAAVGRFWKEKPAELAYAYDGPARTSSYG